MTKNTNIIILSDVPPDSRYTAGQVLDQAISGLPEFQFRFYWLNQSRLDIQTKLPENCTSVAVFSTAYGRLSTFLVRTCNYMIRRVPLLSKPLFLLKSGIALPSLLSTAIRLGWRLRRDPSGLIWFVVQGERPVIAYLIVSWMARKPYLLQQWDPLSWWMGHRHYPRRVIAMTQRLLSHLERRAFVNLVPSETWRELLASQGKRAIRLDNFIKHQLLHEPGYLAIRDSRAVHAVFVGQFYAGEELIRTVSAVLANLDKDGRELVIHLFGSSVPVSLPGCRVVPHGYLERDALIRRISKWDLALLPYPTEKGHEETARLSFPSKARVYLAAGLPILAYAPEFAGVHQFLDKNYSDHYCNIAVTNNMAGFMDTLLEATYQTRHSRYLHARRLVEREFSETAELQPLRSILGEAV